MTYLVELTEKQIEAIKDILDQKKALWAEWHYKGEMSREQLDKNVAYIQEIIKKLDEAREL